ncbi:MAG: O-methyltransferase [Phycisphaerales bacterium]
MASRAARSTQRLFSRFGLRIVQWPRALRHDSDVGSERFFPVGEHRPWTVPEDLRSRNEPWGRALLGVYDDHASWPSSIAPEAGLLLHSLVRNIRPRVIIETGTCLGVSTIWMGSALRAAGGDALHTFDLYCEPPDQRLAASPLFHDRQGGVRRRLADAGLADLVHVHAGDSSTSIKSLHTEFRAAGGVQLAYIDGDHSPRGALADFHAVEPVLNVGGYVILHDTFPDVCNHLGPRWLIDHLADVSSCRYQVCEFYTAQTNYGIAVLRRIE